MAALAPLRVTNTQRKFDITVKVIGGGTSGQAGAIAHGIAARSMPLRPRLPRRAEEGRPSDSRRADEGAQEVRTEASPESSPVHEAVESSPACGEVVRGGAGGIGPAGSTGRTVRTHATSVDFRARAASRGRDILIRSDHLGHLTPVGREALTAYGVSIVIDLRSTSEVLGSPNPFVDGTVARYIHHELIDDANMNNIGDARDMLERYLFVVNNRPEAFRDIFTSVAEAEGGVLFHCFAGKDRTGRGRGDAPFPCGRPARAHRSRLRRDRPASWPRSTKGGSPRRNPTSATRFGTSFAARRSESSASSITWTRGGAASPVTWRRPG